MKKILKYIVPILIFLAIATSANAEWWSKNATQSLVTNDGSGPANADIHVRNCYLGLGTTPCGSAGGGSVTNFSFTDGSGFDGTVTNPTTTPTLSLTTSLTTGYVPFIGALGALTQDTTTDNQFFYDATNHSLGLGTASPFSFGNKLIVLEARTASTFNGRSVIFARDQSTYNTTATARTNYGATIANQSTISAGANPLTNVGLVASASGGTNNYGILVPSGRVGIGTNITDPSSLLDVTSNGLGITQTTSSGLALVNTTAAAAGAQQISPALRWRGNGWKTTSTAASQTVDVRGYVVPIQGTTAPGGTLLFQSSINGASYNNMISLGIGGELIDAFSSSGTSGQVFTSGGAGTPASWTDGTALPFWKLSGTSTLTGGTRIDINGNTANISGAQAGIVMTSAQTIIGDVNSTGGQNTIQINDGIDSSWYDNVGHNAKFGINTASPTVALDVFGEQHIANNGTNPQAWSYTYDSGVSSNGIFKITDSSSGLSLSLNLDGPLGNDQIQTFQDESGLIALVSPTGVGSINTVGPGTSYTPTLTNVTNVTSSTAEVSQYSRVGNIVTVYGSLAIVTTLAVATEVDIELPIASNLNATRALHGLANATSAIGTNGYVDGDSTNDRARLKFIGLAVGGSGTIYYSFQYEVI